MSRRDRAGQLGNRLIAASSGAERPDVRRAVEIVQLAPETGDAASEVLRSTSALIEQSATLRMEVDDFLGEVRKA